MTPTEDAVRELVAPIARDLQIEIYDVEMAGGVLRVLLDKPDGIDMGSITEATRRISRTLDESDPISSSYTLEVSSPGIERNLRVSAHFSSAIGERVKVKTRADSQLERRFNGVLVAFDDPVATVRTDEGADVQVRLDQLERIRTEFVDTASPKPGKGGGAAKSGPKKASPSKSSGKKSKKSTQETKS